MHLEGLLRIETKLFRWQLQPSGLSVMRIQINHNHDDIAQVLGPFAEAENLRIIDGIETQAAIALKGSVFAPDPVHARSELSQAVWFFQIPALDLILLGIQVLF